MNRRIFFRQFVWTYCPSCPSCAKLRLCQNGSCRLPHTSAFTENSRSDARKFQTRMTSNSNSARPPARRRFCGRRKTNKVCGRPCRNYHPAVVNLYACSSTKSPLARIKKLRRRLELRWDPSDLSGNAVWNDCGNGCSKQVSRESE